MLGLGLRSARTIRRERIVIGDAPAARQNLFRQGYSLAAVSPTSSARPRAHRSALFQPAGWLFRAHAARQWGSRACSSTALRIRARRRLRRPPWAPGPVAGAVAAHERAEPASEQFAALCVSPARRRKTKLARGAITAGTVIALIRWLLVLSTAQQGLGLVELELLQPDPTQHVKRRARRRQEARSSEACEDRLAGLGRRRSADRIGGPPRPSSTWLAACEDRASLTSPMLDRLVPSIVLAEELQFHEPKPLLSSS